MPLKATGLDGREATESPQKITEALRIKLKEELFFAQEEHSTRHVSRNQSRVGFCFEIVLPDVFKNRVLHLPRARLHLRNTWMFVLPAVG